MWLPAAKTVNNLLAAFTSGGRGNLNPERHVWSVSNLAPYTDGSGQSNLEVIKQGEAYVRRRKELRYAFTKIVFAAPNNLLYYSTVYKPPGTDHFFDIDELDKKRIPLDEVYPLIPDGETVTPAPNPIPKDVYVKRPNLLYYGDEELPLDVAGHVLREVRACEKLLKDPHPNIAEYRGCIIKDGRIVGVCYKRYRMTLPERLQRDGLMGYPPFERSWCYECLESAIKHLHRLGLTHNNLCPGSIMLDKEDNPVLIGLHCCRPEGEELGPRGYHPGWSLEGARMSRFNNDMFSLLRVRDHLQGLYG